MNADRQTAMRAISEARAALDKLERRIFPSSVINLQAQAESALVFIEAAAEAHRIGTELTAKLATIGCSLGEHELSRSALRDIRSSEVLDDAMADAREWATDMLSECEVA